MESFLHPATNFKSNQIMISINYIKEKKISHDVKLSDHDKMMLLQENRNVNFSYFTLLKEMLTYNHITVNDLKAGWGGVKLISSTDLEN